MNTIKRELYGFIDRLNLPMDNFKVQGIVIIVLAAIKSVLLLILAISSATLLGFLANMGLLPYELAGMFGYLGAKFFILILPLLIALGFLLYIEFKAGLVAMNSLNNLEKKDEVLKWAKNYIIYILFLTLFSLFSGVKLIGLITIILNIISAILYFYFSQKLAASNVN